LQRGLLRWQLNEQEAAQSDFAQAVKLNPALEVPLGERLRALRAE
jgi:hypothetical protein